MPRLCTYRLNRARILSRDWEDGQMNQMSDTDQQTQDLKFDRVSPSLLFDAISSH